jgi:hypothetical protein
MRKLRYIGLLCQYIIGMIIFCLFFADIFSVKNDQTIWNLIDKGWTSFRIFLDIMLFNAAIHILWYTEKDLLE